MNHIIVQVIFIFYLNGSILFYATKKPAKK